MTTCETCAYAAWGKDADLGFLECRRYAPRYPPKVEKLSTLRVWVAVRFDDWCGEFEQSLRKKDKPVLTEMASDGE